MKLDVKAEDLLPELPEPKDLRPFPTTLALTYSCESTVRALGVEPRGQFFASVSDDKILRVWELGSGRCLRKVPLPANETAGSDSPPLVNSVAWCPNPALSVVAVSIGASLYLVNAGVGDKLIVAETDVFLRKLDTNRQALEGSENVVRWKKVDEKSGLNGLRICIQHTQEVVQVTWHHAGDYFATVSPGAGSNSILLHQLSKMKTQVMFSKLKGTPKRVLFHPLRPTFFVVTQRFVRVYDLVKQHLSKKLLSNCKNISSVAIHPKGDNIIIGSYDCRLDWFDLDLSSKPYRTFGKHHKAAVRAVAFHRHLPLFASCSSDGSLVVCHGMVYSDMMQNPLIVPLKILRSERRNVDLRDCCFHPAQPWLLAGGSDGLVRLYA